MHQRPDDRDRRVLRGRRLADRRADPRGALADGGWNCEAENGSVRSSFDTTINVLEGLLDFERANGGSAEVREARRGGEEYLLERACSAARAPAKSQAGVSRLRVPVLLALRRASNARLLPTAQAPSRIPGWGQPWRSCGLRGGQTAGGCSTAPSRPRLFRSRERRRRAEPLEHALRAARPQMVGVGASA